MEAERDGRGDEAQSSLPSAWICQADWERRDLRVINGRVAQRRDTARPRRE